MASVLISGAGPIGLTMANELARYGADEQAHGDCASVLRRKECSVEAHVANLSAGEDELAGEKNRVSFTSVPAQMISAYLVPLCSTVSTLIAVEYTEKGFVRAKVQL